jgi:hypothetical protein
MDNSPSSTEPTGSELPATADAGTELSEAARAIQEALPDNTVALVLPVADHAESVSLFARIETKLATVTHDDLKADVAKLKALLHL